jgi:signal transduction histidine kinase/HAMP domain-containing protein
MKVLRLHQSLRFKVTAGVLLPLLIILSILAYVRHINYQNLLMENVQRSAANAGEIIEGSLQHAMLTNDFSTLQQIADNIGQQPGVLDLFLVGKQGHVLITTESDMIGRTIDLADPTCQACHRYEATSRNENVVLTLDGGRRVFRNANAIENAPECTSCHSTDLEVLGVLISDFDLGPVETALAMDRRNSLLWSIGSVVLIVLVVDLLMSRMVISRLEQFVRAIKRVSEGDLDSRLASDRPDEIGELSRSFNHMADGLKEKERLELSLKERTEQLQSQAEKLSTLNTIATTVSQSLNLEEILHSALDKVLELMQLRASWVMLGNGQDPGCDLVAISGLPREVALAHVQCASDRCACSRISGTGQATIVHDALDRSCPSAEYLARGGFSFRACVPLTSKGRVLGVMSLLGDAADQVQTLNEETLEMLTAIGRQMGMAIENASLYEELRQEEMLRRRLLERVITVQEEERKRIALELHDETGQPLTSLIMTLGVLSEAGSMAEVKTHVQDLRDTAAQVLKEVHDLALEIRPSVLDDLGLLPALRHLHKEYQDRFRIPVDLAVLELGEERLPPEVETTLYRIVQEALTNVARHAQAQSVSVLLERRGHSVKLIVEDNGKGFDVAEVLGSDPPADKLGLYGMRERASLLDGTLTIESTPGMGTTVFVEIPLRQQESAREQNSLVGG